MRRRADSPARVNDLGHDRIGPLLWRLAAPSITAQLVNALYNVVDRMFIGHIAGVGHLALTGVGVAFPVVMFLSAAASLVGMGGSARAAIRMGEGKRERAEEILGNCAALLCLISAAATVLFEVFRRPLLLAFGASGETIAYASDYLGIYLLGTVFVLASLGLNYFITFQGFSTVAMETVVLGAGLNVALDPIFIFTFGLGVKGAAIATVISQGASAVWVTAFLLGKRSRLRIRRGNLRLSRAVVLPVLGLGVSPFVMHGTESLLTLAYNATLQHYGGDLAVGAVTICYSVMQMFALVMQGLAQGAQPILSFNYGSGQTGRVREAFRLLIRWGLGVSIAVCLLIELFPGAVVGAFTGDPALSAETVRALRVYAAGMFMLGIQFPCQQSFLALSQAKVSLLLALLRKIVLLIPLILILPVLLPANPVFAVFLAEPVSDILSGSTTGTVFALRFPRILRERETALGKDTG